jgi:hypothetical protein
MMILKFVQYAAHHCSYGSFDSYLVLCNTRNHLLEYIVKSDTRIGSVLSAGKYMAVLCLIEE